MILCHTDLYRVVGSGVLSAPFIGRECAPPLLSCSREAAFRVFRG